MHSKCTILHIEDEDGDYMLFKRGLRQLNFTGNYVRVRSFDEAKRLLEEQRHDNEGVAPPPSLIVADSKVGIYNGLDILRWVKEQPDIAQTPVVVYSSAISPTQREQVLKEGAAGCLTKPIDDSLPALEMILSYAETKCKGAE